MTYLERLVAYVKSENQAGRYPEVRTLARRYRVRQGDILTLVEDTDDLIYNVGLATYSGYGVYDRPGDYTVEWLGD